MWTKKTGFNRWHATEILRAQSALGRLLSSVRGLSTAVPTKDSIVAEQLPYISNLVCRSTKPNDVCTHQHPLHEQKSATDHEHADPKRQHPQTSDSQSMGTRTVGKLIIVVKIWTGTISAGEALFVSCDGGGRDEGLRVSHWKRASQSVEI